LKLLVIDCDGVGLAFCLRAAKAGHSVRYFVKPKPTNSVHLGEGFPIEKITNWVGSVKWADLIWVSGNEDYLQRLDFFRKQGAKVFGPSYASARLEIERAKGMEFFKAHGIEVPPYQTFKSLSDAEAHVRKTEERFVFKTLGDNDDKSLSYVSKSPADMIARLQRWQRLKMNPKGPVMLQQFIPGIELGVSRFMGTEGFLGPYNENFEHKKLLSGNCGPNCGEAGTVQKYITESALGEEVLLPLEKALRDLGHLGDVDVNCIIDEKGQAWPLEFTCRPGWPAFNIMLAEHRDDPLEWMLDACNGRDSLDVSFEHACGIVVAQPDYPYSEKTQAETLDIPIYGVTKSNEKFLFPQSVRLAKLPLMEGEKLTEGQMWATCGDYLLVVTGMGKSVKQACQRAYKTLAEIEVPDMIWRDDIGEKLKTEIPELQKHGFAMDFTYG
jgi:phosphoribosylamine--glycine ligase